MDEIRSEEERDAAEEFGQHILSEKVYGETRQLGVMPVKLLSGSGTIADLHIEGGPDVWERVNRPFIVLECAHPDSTKQSVIYKARVEDDPRESLQTEIDFYRSISDDFRQKMLDRGVEIPQILTSDDKADPPFFVISYIQGVPIGSIHKSTTGMIDRERLKKIVYFVSEYKKDCGRARSQDGGLQTTDRFEQYRRGFEGLEELKDVLGPDLIAQAKSILQEINPVIASQPYSFVFKDINPSNILEEDSGIGVIDFERDSQSNNPYCDYSFLYITLWNQPELQEALLQEVLSSSTPDSRKFILMDVVFFRIASEIKYWKKQEEEDPDGGGKDSPAALIALKGMLIDCLRELGEGSH